MDEQSRQRARQMDMNKPKKKKQTTTYKDDRGMSHHWGTSMQTQTLPRVSSTINHYLQSVSLHSAPQIIIQIIRTTVSFLYISDHLTSLFIHQVCFSFFRCSLAILTNLPRHTSAQCRSLSQRNLSKQQRHTCKTKDTVFCISKQRFHLFLQRPTMKQTE